MNREQPGGRRSETVEKSNCTCKDSHRVRNRECFRMAYVQLRTALERQPQPDELPENMYHVPQYPATYISREQKDECINATRNRGQDEQNEPVMRTDKATQGCHQLDVPTAHRAQDEQRYIDTQRQSKPKNRTPYPAPAAEGSVQNEATDEASDNQPVRN